LALDHGSKFVVESSSDEGETSDETSDESGSETSNSVDLSSMILYDYGKGYLLEPLTTSDYYGQKYFHNGYWMPSQDGWFFKTSEYDWLLENGAFDDSNETSDRVDLSHMCVEKYKKGYILKTNKKDTLYGTKYFLDGFWNTNVNGWFFKKQYLDKLVEMGAKLIKDEDECVLVSEDTKFNYKPNFVKYGKGYLLKADNHYKFDGNYYLENDHGWWVSKGKGWFFKTSQKNAFLKKYFS